MEDTGTSGASKSGTRAKTSQACVRCRQKKSKCDGEAPSCSNCVSVNEECVYRAYQRVRGPGRSKQHVRALEQRLSHLEARLQRNEDSSRSAPAPLSSSNQDANVPAAGAEPSMAPEQPRGPAEGVATQSADATGHGQSLGLEELSIKEAAQRRMPFFKMVTDRIATDLKSPALTDCLGPIPGQHIAVKQPDAFLIENTIQEICDDLPIFDVPSFKRWVREPGTLVQRGNPSQWACLNAVAGLSILLKSLSASYRKVALFPWAFMKNAYSVLPEVMLQGDGIWGVQAILAMVIFMMKASGDTRTAAMLLSVAVRAMHAGGLRSSPQSEDEMTTRVFWSAYVLDAEIGLNCGIPSLLHDEDIDFALPHQSISSGIADVTPSGSSSTSIFALRAELAMIQARIRKQLYSSKALSLPDSELLKAATHLSSTLESWRSKVPVDVRPGQDGQPSDSAQSTPAIMLHLVFHNCMSMVYWAACRFLKRSTESTADFYTEQISESRIRVQAAAKAVANLHPKMKGKSTADSWRMLPYILSSALSSLVFILDEPTKAEARSDLEILDTLASVLEALVADEGMCFGSVLKRFVAMREAARNAVSGRTAVAFAAASAECYHLKVTLDRMTHPMLVAQALLGNVQNRDTDVARSLSAALSMPWEPEYPLSPWVPEAHRPDTYGFKYNLS